MINWREYEATIEGPQGLRSMVQILQEVLANPSIQPMVQALIHENNLIPSRNDESPKRATRNPRVSNKEEHSCKITPQRQHVPHSPMSLAKRCHPRTSPISLPSKERQISESGRNLHWRRRSPS